MSSDAALGTPPTHSQPLQYLGGFELLEVIGRGGMGAVYKARQPNLNRIVALKILPPGAASRDPAAVERFIREARVTARFNHPHVVQGIEVGRDEATGLYYFAMEYVNGPNLKDLLRQAGAIEARRGLSIVRQVAEALAYARKLGIVHRDIKPDNVLLNSRGEAKLADLGLARQMSMAETFTPSGEAPAADASLTQAGVTVGTPYYMPPEQARGRLDLLDVRSDLYALGATLYHMLAGRPPYQGRDSVSIMRKHIDAPIPRLLDVRPELDPEIGALVERMLQKDPGRRFQSPEDLIERIDAILEPRTTQAPARPRPRQEGRVGAPVTALRAGRGHAVSALRAGKHGGTSSEMRTPRSGNPLRPSGRRRGLLPQLALVGAVALACVALAAMLFRAPPKKDEAKPQEPIRSHEAPPERPEPKAERVDPKPLASETDGSSSARESPPVRGERGPVDGESPNRPLEKVRRPAVERAPESSKDERKTTANPVAEAPPIVVLPAPKAGDLISEIPFTRPERPAVPAPPAEARESEADFAVRVAALAPEAAAKAVAERLKLLNPGYDGAFEPGILGGRLMMLGFRSEQLRDVSPLAAIPTLHALSLTGLSPTYRCPLKDVTPLAKLRNLRELNLSCSMVADLAPLKDLPLVTFYAAWTEIVDLEPLRGMPLNALMLGGAKVESLEPLRGRRLTRIDVGMTKVRDLSPLHGMPLELLGLFQIKVVELKPLVKPSLKSLRIDKTGVAGLGMLKGLPALEELWCDYDLGRDGELLRSLPALQRLNGKAAGKALGGSGKE
ncbi:MAG: protein kinase [Planctomycetota bacterium]|nr:protein kinase [Planctomycetota bacterium]